MAFARQPPHDMLSGQSAILDGHGAEEPSPLTDGDTLDEFLHQFPSVKNLPQDLNE